jgi:acetyltransferase-like isoleucine patch superfamily enzyme
MSPSDGENAEDLPRDMLAACAPTSWAIRIRRGDGPLSSRMKSLAQALLRFHVPIVGLTRPVFGALYCVHAALREAIGFVLRLFWFEPLFRSQCDQVGDNFYMEQMPYLSGNGAICLGEDVRLSGKSSILFGNRFRDRPELIVGDHTFIGHECSFRIADSVRIGRHCLLAGGVMIGDFDGHPLDAMRRRAAEPTPPEQIREVTIEDDVWIGARAAILKGVTIGARSVVAAGAVVTKSVPADAIVAGNPARVVRRLGESGAPSPAARQDAAGDLTPAVEVNGSRLA